LRWAALLHDIGKLTVRSDTLNKPEALDAAEWEAIQAHPHEGARLAAPLLDWLGPWGDAIAQHHERFDGAGYPAGLAGEEISHAARIVAVADSYDTMTSARAYQKPKSTAAARRELVACAGTQFDPVIVRAFLAISLPRLLWAVGPVSLLVHVPFLTQLQQAGQVSLASVTTAAQSATVGAVAGVTAVALISGGAAKATTKPHPHSGSRAASTTISPLVAPAFHMAAPMPDATTSHAQGATHHGHKPRPPKGHDPKHHEPKHHEPKHHDPKGHDPKGHDPKHHEPKHRDPKGHDPKGHDPKHHDGEDGGDHESG
jgi:hypothetical protein